MDAIFKPDKKEGHEATGGPALRYEWAFVV